MHAVSLLQTWLERNGVIGHQARISALMRVVESLLSGGKLSLTQLGRYRAGTAYVKHHIKAVDRLLGNHHLHAEREAIYRALSTRVLAGVARPVIVVDWADTARDRDWLTLRASVPVDGRAITLYEEVHPLRHYNTSRTHRQFLNTLHRVLPASCPGNVTARLKEIKFDPEGGYEADALDAWLKLCNDEAAAKKEVL